MFPFVHEKTQNDDPRIENNDKILILCRYCNLKPCDRHYDFCSKFCYFEFNKNDTKSLHFGEESANCVFCHRRPPKEDSLFCGWRCERDSLIRNNVCIFCRDKPLNYGFLFCSRECGRNHKNSSKLFNSKN